MVRSYFELNCDEVAKRFNRLNLRKRKIKIKEHNKSILHYYFRRDHEANNIQAIIVVLVMKVFPAATFHDVDKFEKHRNINWTDCI